MDILNEILKAFSLINIPFLVVVILIGGLVKKM